MQKFNENNSEPIGRQDAVQLGHDWVTGRYGKSNGRDGATEIRALAVALVKLAIEESLRLAETDSALNTRISWIGNFLDNLQSVGRSRKIEEMMEASSDNLSNELKSKKRRHGSSVWIRYNVTDSYAMAFKDNISFYDQDKSDIHLCASEYLRNEWARHPSIDWMLLDMMNTQETCAFGMHLRMASLTPGRLKILRLSKQFTDAAGFKEYGTLFLLWVMRQISGIAFGWAIPIALIWFLFKHDYTTAGWIVLGIFFIFTAWWLIALIIRTGFKLYSFATGRSNPIRQPEDTLKTMIEVWNAMEGEVINPTLVKEAMIKSRSFGAVWDAPAWAIIDAVILRNPAIWVTSVR